MNNFLMLWLVTHVAVNRALETIIKTLSIRSYVSGADNGILRFVKQEKIRCLLLESMFDKCAPGTPG